MVCAARVERTSRAYKARALPLSYTQMVDPAGVEPAWSALGERRISVLPRVDYRQRT